MRRGLLQLMVVVLACLPVAARADLFPRYAISRMAYEAELIVEGTWLGGDQIRVERVYKQPKTREPGEVITVGRLAQHGRTIRQTFRPQPDDLEIEARKVLLFATYFPSRKVWRPMGVSESDGETGSAGVFWYNDLTLFGYAQLMNPGPAVLMQAGNAGWDIPDSIQDARRQIDLGMANLAEWERCLAIEDPHQKAEALAGFLSKDTAPKGYDGQFRVGLRRELAALGNAAIPSLRALLRRDPPLTREETDNVVLIIHDMGRAGSLAVPELGLLLEQPERASTGYVLSAIAHSGHVAAADTVRPYLQHENPQVRAAAERGMARIAELQAADAQ